MAGRRRAHGTGSIIHRGNRYSVVLDLGKGADGKRKREWHSGYRTRQDAEKALAELVTKLDRGTYVPRNRFATAAYFDRWLAYKAGRVEPETLERYREYLTGYANPHIGHIPIQQLRAMHLVDLYDHLARDGRRLGEGGLRPQTILHLHRIISQALKQAVRWQLVAVNVADAVAPPSVPDRSVPALSRDQATALVDQAEGTMRMVVVLALATGMRRGELVALQWSGVDLAAGRLRVEASVRVTPKVGRRRKQPKTTAGRRVIELHPFAVAELRRHRAKQARMRLLFGSGYDTDADLVIAKADGSAYHPDSLTNYFRLLARKVGLPSQVSLHGLRHAVASFLAAEGTSASDIAAVLGHADRGQLAQKVYIRPLEDAPARAAKRLGRALGWTEASS